ncbi:MAG: hypothetical protein R3Y54_05960 [Eubacteriales bacterium]
MNKVSWKWMALVLCITFMNVTGCNMSHSGKIESQVIAVVNLDEGVYVNKVKSYYAEEIIQFPTTMFQYTSLDNARAGLENGRYGAYVVIPATFSECIESLNREPQVAELRYALNENHSVEVQEQLLQTINNLSVNLNNSITYMYINNVLDSFHTAQDGAVIVMKNDLTDKQVINEIEPLDIVTMISIPELGQLQYTVSPMDLTPYTTYNVELLTSVNDQYLGYIETTQLQLSQLQEEGTIVRETLQTLVNEVVLVEVNKVESGEYIQDLASSKVDEELVRMQEVVVEDLELLKEEIAEELLELRILSGAIIPVEPIDNEEYEEINSDEINTELESIQSSDISKIASKTIEIDDVIELLELYESKIEQSIELVKTVNAIDESVLKTIFIEEYVKPIEENVNIWKEETMNRYEQETELIETYGEQLEEYTPDDSTGFVTTSISNMRENNMQMQEEIYANHREHMEVTHDIYQTTEENIRILTEHIDHAKEESNLAVELGLENAISVKNQLSANNQLILEDFSKLLEYTRLGSLENTRVYEFMIKPTEMRNLLLEK